MRIVEQEKIAPIAAAAKIQPEEPESLSGAQPEIIETKHRRQPRTRRRHTLARFVMACILMLAVIFASLAYLIFFVAGPIVKAVDSVPRDFPKDIAIYELDQAKVKVQTAQSKMQLSNLLKSLPNWSLAPFSNYLTGDLKTQVAAKLKDPNLLPKNLSLSDLEKSLGQSATSTKTVDLAWNDINKTKEDLTAYYKKQLQASGYTVNEKLSDAEIDLSFFKPGIDGAMSIADSFMKDNSSIVKMTVDYLSK